MADGLLGLPLLDTADAESGADQWLLDRLLAERLRANEPAAYEQLIERFQQPVYNLVARLLNDPNEAADIVQEVFLKIFRKIESFRGECSLKTWIYRIAVHEAYNQRRWFRRHRQQETCLDNDDDGAVNFFEVVPDAGRSPFQVTLDHETRARIETALGELKPVFRAAVVLRDIEELSYEEIAQVLDVNLGTVKTRILRGREALRKELLAQESQQAIREAGWAAQPAGH